ncbi:MAG: SulP family inorganic anion transporter [Candidatus Nitricoxidivorans perseverans]|uniref:SulP family inorganic anion transporter n=1 Tax=Candidatus Nitricoxidivorans perseverans TaxID=2975601 RepID=A0AA49IXW5_9PROT|nr:MAG: SulP family inorganic anion transporter [Candidatus Nitricoxidivorans perseverans]
MKLSPKALFPFLRWLPYRGETLRADFIAGLTVALVLVPQSMAYAQLAGLPAYYGLYAAFLPVMVAVLWGSSNQLGTGPVAVVSLLTASSLSVFAAPGSDEFVALAIMLALLVGVVQLALGVFKLGVIVNFLSHPVIVGFTNAAAMIIGLSQVNKLIGVPMGRSEHFIQDIWGVIQKTGDTHLPTLAMGVVAIAIMWAIRRKAPKLPGVLIAVAITTTASWAMDFEAALGGKVVGGIPEGLPSLSLPTISWDKVGSLLSAAIVISLVGFMEAISIAKAIAARTKQRIDPNQELIGQGLANIVGAMSQAFPVSGSFSRSAVNINAGALTGMSSVFTGLFVLLTLLLLTPLLYHLPQAVLAAVIIMAVIGLINFDAVKHAWHANKHDGIAAVVTFIATLAAAPHLDNGIMVGAGLAIGLYLYRTMSPRVAILGRYHDGTLRDARVHHLPASDVVTAVRFDGRLYFANVAYFEDAILEAVAENPKARHLLVVADGINEMDASGEEVMHHIVERLRGGGVTVAFSGLKKQVIDVMRATGLFEAIGQANIHATADHALAAIYAQAGDGGREDALRPIRATAAA